MSCGIGHRCGVGLGAALKRPKQTNKQKGGAWHAEECIFLGHKSTFLLMAMSGSQLDIQIQGAVGFHSRPKMPLSNSDSVGPSADFKKEEKKKKKIYPQPSL